jgi:hypothetical protein
MGAYSESQSAEKIQMGSQGNPATVRTRPVITISFLHGMDRKAPLSIANHVDHHVACDDDDDRSMLLALASMMAYVLVECLFAKHTPRISDAHPLRRPIIDANHDS